MTTLWITMSFINYLAFFFKVLFKGSVRVRAIITIIIIVVIIARKLFMFSVMYLVFFISLSLYLYFSKDTSG